MKSVIILSGNQQATIIVGSGINKVNVKPHPVNLVKVTGKWVDGKYKTTAEKIAGGMSDSIFLENLCKGKNLREGIRTKDLQVSFMLMDQEMTDKMNGSNH